MPGSPGTANPRAASSGLTSPIARLTVDLPTPVHHGQSLVRELEPQVNEGDDDPVSERQVMVRPGAGRAQPLMAAALEQPVFPGGGPRHGQFPDQPGQMRAAYPGPDTIRQGRAGQS